MNWVRIGLILFSIAFAVWVLFEFHIWADEFKQMFFYQSDWVSYIMVFALLFAIGWGIKLLVVQVAVATRGRKK